MHLLHGTLGEGEKRRRVFDMTHAQENRTCCQPGTKVSRTKRGYSVVEIMMAMMIASILTAVAIPQVKSGLYYYRLNSAVAMAKWAIQSTRFQALMKGYRYQVAFTAATQSYQIQNLPSGTTYSNVGSSVPLASWPMTVNQDITINFQPNGMVTTNVSTSSFTITYQGKTNTISVSNYGNVTVQ
jgi:prepilin-type N-terminal cleavage/methylation domain-containing protein